MPNSIQLLSHVNALQLDVVPPSYSPRRLTGRELILATIRDVAEEREIVRNDHQFLKHIHEEYQRCLKNRKVAQKCLLSCKRKLVIAERALKKYTHTHFDNSDYQLEPHYRLLQSQLLHLRLEGTLLEKMLGTGGKEMVDSIDQVVQAEMEVERREMEKGFKVMAFYCLNKGFVPEKPVGVPEFTRIYETLLAKMAKICCQEGSVDPLPEGSSGVYRLSYQGRPLFVFKPDDEGIGQPHSPKEIDLDTALLKSFPLGQGGLRDYLSGSGPLSKRKVALATLSHGNFSVTTENKRGVLVAYVTSKGSLEDFDLSPSRLNSLRKDSSSEEALVEEKKIRGEALRMSLDPEKIYPNAMDMQLNFFKQCDADSLLGIIVEDLLGFNTDANIGNVLVEKVGRQQYILHAIDYEQTQPVEWKEVPINTPFWIKLPQARAPMPEKWEKGILKLDIESENKRKMGVIASLTLSEQDRELWERALQRSMAHQFAVQAAVKNRYSPNEIFKIFEIDTQIQGGLESILHSCVTSIGDVDWKRYRKRVEDEIFPLKK